MKKIMILFIALVMALSAMPISATESIPMEVANPDIEVLTSFVSCTFPTCTGLVVKECNESIWSDTELAFDCHVTDHNKYGACSNYYVYFTNKGYCNKCFTSLDELVSRYHLPIKNSYHVHAFRHVYPTSNGTYRTEIWPSCNI